MQIVEFEALVRWNHPERGPVPPGEFISVAEDCGAIEPLGLWILRKACSQFKEWLDGGAPVADIALGANVSSRQFANPKFVENVRMILRETEMDPHRLRIEITEGSVMENTAYTRGVLEELSKTGIRFHLDDFGTGYSSLSYLGRMPIEALKIDRSFVTEMAQDPVSQSIVRAIIALAHTLGMSAIAEGVESPDDMRILQELGCDSAQGYCFSRPCDAAAAIELLRVGVRCAEKRCASSSEPSVPGARAA